MWHKTGMIVAVAVLALAGSAQAGILQFDANGMSAFQGTKLYEGRGSDLTLYYTAQIDYCVYEPGKFALTFPDAQDPNDYVYAYQVLNVHTGDYPQYAGYVTKFSIGIDPNGGGAEPWGIGYISGPEPNVVTPSTYYFSPGTGIVSTAGWNWPQSKLDANSMSPVLYFSSPFGPQWMSASVTGTSSKRDTELLPSAVPEPGALAIAALGVPWFLRRARRRVP